MFLVGRVVQRGESERDGRIWQFLLVSLSRASTQRCPKDGGQMSRTCRHIAEAAQAKACRLKASLLSDQRRRPVRNASPPSGTPYGWSRPNPTRRHSYRRSTGAFPAATQLGRVVVVGALVAVWWCLIGSTRWSCSPKRGVDAVLAGCCGSPRGVPAIHGRVA